MLKHFYFVETLVKQISEKMRNKQKGSKTKKPQNQ